MQLRSFDTQMSYRPKHASVLLIESLPGPVPVEKGLKTNRYEPLGLVAKRRPHRPGAYCSGIRLAW